MSVVGNRDPPREIAASHGRHRAEVRQARRRGRNIRRARHPVDELRSFRKRSLHARLVQVEPARTLRRHALRIDGDHFEVERAAERRAARCACPSPVLAARRRPSAERLLDPVATARQRDRRDDEMVGLDDRGHQAFGGLRRARSRAPRARRWDRRRRPARSRCRPAGGRCARRRTRRACASVSARPCEVNAMWSITPERRFSRGLPPTTCRIAASPA